jgi:hypothetical protein
LNWSFWEKPHKYLLPTKNEFEFPGKAHEEAEICPFTKTRNLLNQKTSTRITL